MSQEGIVCFLDLLGYSKLIEHNPIGYVADLVNEVLLDDPPKLQEDILDKLSEASGKTITDEYVRKIYDKMTSSVFSDTIVLSIPLDDLDALARCSAWWQFNLWVICIFRNLFSKGLPCRGIIDYGNYYHSTSKKGVLIAGSIFSRAHNLLNSISAACLIFPEPAVEQCRQDVRYADPRDVYINGISIPGPVSQKAAYLEHHSSFSGRILGFWNYNDTNANAMSFVENQFRAHNKPLDTNNSDIVMKLYSTVKIIEKQTENWARHKKSSELAK